MTHFPNVKEPQNLYELSWIYAHVGKVAVDTDTGLLLDANPTAEALLGYSREELIGMHATMLHPESERELVEADFRKAMLRPSPHFGLHIQRKDGRSVPVAIWSSEKLKLDGRSVVISEFRDFTVRKDAETHLVQLEERYRGLMEATPDGMVVVNQGGEIVLLNARAESQFGYRRDELLGQKVTNIIPKGFAERLIADGTRTAAEVLAQQIGTGIELHGRRKDGTEFPIEIMLSPLESPEGILVTAAIRDITVRKKAEQRLVIAVDAAQIGTWELDLVNDISIRNLRHDQIFGYQSLLAEWGSNTFFLHVAPDEKDSVRQAFANAFECGKLFFECCIVWPDETIHWISVYGKVQYDSAGKPETMTGTVADITERKDADKHLVQMEGRYRGLLEAAPDGMMVVNQNGEIVLLNARA
jgi:PAS domain S-box-containing protein